MKNEVGIITGKKEFVCTNGLRIKNYTVKDVIGSEDDKNDNGIGEENYFKLLNLFIVKPYDMKVTLWDSGIDYIDLQNYDIFILLWQNDDLIYQYKKVYEQYDEGLVVNPYKNYVTYRELMNSFIGHDYDLTLVKDKSSDKMVIKDSKTDATIIDRLAYNEIAKYLRHIHFITEKTLHNPNNKKARESIIKEDRRKQEKEKKMNKEVSYPLKDYLSTIIWLSGSGYTWENIGGLTIYQLYEGIKRIEKDKKASHLYHGIYANGVDTSKIRELDLEWMGSLNRE